MGVLWFRKMTWQERLAEYAPGKGKQVGIFADLDGKLYSVNGDGERRLLSEGEAEGGGGPHDHPLDDVTGLAAALDAKADDHAHPYAADDHGHTAAEVGAAATGHDHDAEYEPVHAHPYAATAHDHDGAYAAIHGHPYADTTHSHVDGDLPAGLARDAEVAAAYSPLGHSHSHPDLATHDALGLATDAELTAHAATEHGGSLPAGLIVMWGGLVANIPSGWLLCNGANGTPDLRDRFIKGAAAGQDPGATGGAATHTHAAHSDHAALTHSGATVGNHNVTQPSAHSDHTLSGAIANESAHTHTYTQTVNHVHVQNAASAATGGLVGSTPDASTNTSVASGYSTANPTGGVASGTTAAGSAHGHGNGTLATSAHSAHSGTAVDAHSVGQASQHAAQSHSAHDSPNSEPAYFALCFIQKT